MSQKSHRIFIDSVARDSDELKGKEEMSRYTYSISGQMFATDGKHVYLPYDVGEGVTLEVQGAIAHEVLGHGTYSDWTVVDGVGRNFPHLGGLLNVWEDVRVDNMVARRYPQMMVPGQHYYRLLEYSLDKLGSKQNIEQARVRLDKRVPDNEIRISLEVLWMHYKRLGITGGLGDNHPLTTKPITDFIAKHRQVIEKMLDAASSPNSSTKKMLSLANKFYQLIHGIKPEPIPQNQNQKPELVDVEVPETSGGAGSGEAGPECSCGCHN